MASSQVNTLTEIQKRLNPSEICTTGEFGSEWNKMNPEERKALLRCAGLSHRVSDFSCWEALGANSQQRLCKAFHRLYE